MSELTIGSLFSGIGGLELGLERATGGRVVWQAEQNMFCRAALAKHWPEARRYADVREIRRGTAARVDIICGGFPCQDISVAGSGAGISGARSGLWSEYARIVDDLRPRFVVVENVAVLRSRGLGRVLGDLSALGYDAFWDCIPAAAVGAPHRRDRLYLVAWRVPNANSQRLRNEPERGQGSTHTSNSGHSIAAHVGGNLADAYGARRERADSADTRTQLPECREHCCIDVADANGARQLQPQGRELGIGRWLEHSSDWPPAPNDMHTWRAVPADAQPAFCRLADGVSNFVVGRRNRLKAAGNAAVPQCAEVCGHVINMLMSSNQGQAE